MDVEEIRCEGVGRIYRAQDRDLQRALVNLRAP
jgi:hypothetical protein